VPLLLLDTLPERVSWKNATREAEDVSTTCENTKNQVPLPS
jgi:hypothetical protein